MLHKNMEYLKLGETAQLGAKQEPEGIHYEHQRAKTIFSMQCQHF